MKKQMVDKFFDLEQRLKNVERLVLENEPGSVSQPFKKCRSSYAKNEIAMLFYVLMDEGILYFDSEDPKANRIRLQEFISRNFTYKDKNGMQKAMSRVSRQFSECKGYTYKSRQIKLLDQFIALMQERKTKLERW